MIISAIPLLFLFASATSLGKKSMIVKRSEYEDQKVSASGYTFQSDGNGPVAYSSYRLDNGNLQNVPYAYFGPHRALGKPGFQASPYTYFDDGISSYSKFLHRHVPSYQHGLNLSPSIPVENSLPFYNNALYKNGLHGGNYAYANQDGRSYEGANNLVEGARKENGFKNQEDFDDTSKGNHLKENHQEEYSENGGNKANKKEKAGYHSQSAEAAKGAEGSSYGKTSGHRKGSKTTGYHKVYHKDEYKKDHSFYDEKDTSGHHNVYDKNDSKYEKENGKFENGENSETANEESDYASKGFKDQGKYLDENSGSIRKQGNSANFENNEKYAKEKENQYQDANGYAVSDSE